jgi:hypothetical protein
MLGADLNNRLVELGYAREGVSTDARYDIWFRASRGRFPTKRIRVPNSLIVPDFAAERILADAARWKP